MREVMLAESQYIRDLNMIIKVLANVCHFVLYHLT